MVNKVSISNFKSIYKQDIKLGRINVFIGENGSGKSNILEAIAMAAASFAEELDDVESLINRGIRVTKPSLTFNSFLGMANKNEIKIDVDVDEIVLQSILKPVNNDDIYSKWMDEKSPIRLLTEIFNPSNNLLNKENQIDPSPLVEATVSVPKNIETSVFSYAERRNNAQFLIYNLSTNALRGITKESKKQPLGINGEGLDTLLSTFTDQQKNSLKLFNFISWLNDVQTDMGDTKKYKGYKLGRSTSDLYFTDKFMQENNNLFSAENANEGALHVLFYLALFISERTPSFFAIDNIESALNPMLCRQVTKSIAELAKNNNKQALITTHNPAVLDGLNLHDDDQRLFVVKRTDEGHTKVERIKLKPEVKDEKLKLSELWMRGYLGALPSNVF